MKKLKMKFLSGLFAVVTMFGMVSCSEDNDSNSAAPPVINSVSASVDAEGMPVDLTPVTQGYADNVYIIQGSGFSTVKKVFINDMDTYFNPTLVTDNTIFITIDRNTPYSEQADEIRIVTDYGTATFGFVVAPPAPALTSFNPINAAPGETVTIYGSFFLNPEVRFGDIPATVVSSTLTEIQVTVPNGAHHKYVTVSTISGESTSTQAVDTAVYDDVFYGLNTGGSSLWNGNDVWDMNWTEDAAQGEKSMKLQLGGWNGIDMRLATGVDLTPYKGLRISVKGATAGSLKYLFNDNWSITPNLPVTTEWTTIEILFSTMGNPATFNGITFQESGNTGGNTVLVDDIGFILAD